MLTWFVLSAVSTHVQVVSMVMNRENKSVVALANLIIYEVMIHTTIPYVTYNLLNLMKNIINKHYHVL